MKLTSKVISLTFVGGALGTFFRYALSSIPEPLFFNFWVANLLGVILIAAFNHFGWFAKDERKAFFTVGFTGGFTTMSGLSALMLYTPLEVVIQALVGVALYVLVTWLLKRGQRVS